MTKTIYSFEIVNEKVKKLVAKILYCNPVNLDNEKNIYALIDSLDRVELQMQLEDDFNIVIKDDEIQKVQTICDLSKLVHSKLSV
jgi:acyl carrier protein